MMDETHRRWKLSWFMTSETKERHELRNDYLNKDQLEKEHTGNYTDSCSENIQQLALLELPDAYAMKRLCKQMALPIVVQKARVILSEKEVYVHILLTNDP